MQLKTRHATLLIGVLTVCVLLPGIVGLTMVRRQECRVVLTAQEMVETGQWLMPHYLGQPRLEKPPLVYWAVAAIMKLAPVPASTTVARLAALFFALALAFATWCFAAVLMGRRRALLAAFVLVTNALFIRHAGLAETDLPLALFTLLAVWAGYEASRRATASWWGWFAVFLGLAFMTKGPAGLLVPLVTVLLHALFASGRRPFKAGHVVVALIIFTAVAVPWYAWTYVAVRADPQLASVFGDELERILEGTGHDKPFHYYLPRLPLRILPWGVLLPFALVVMVGRWRRNERLRYLLTWWLVTFIMLSAVRKKQEHYMMLLLPSSCMIIGWFLRSGFVRLASWRARLCRGYVTGVVIVLGLGGAAVAALPFVREEAPRMAGLLLGAMIMLCAAAALRWPVSFGGRLSAAGGLLVLYVLAHVVVVHPVHRPESVLPEFAAKCAPELKDTAAVYYAGSHLPMMTFYLHRALKPLPNAEAWRGANAPGSYLVLTGDKHAPAALASWTDDAVVEMGRGDVWCLLYRGM